MARRPVNAPYTITTQFGVPDSYAKFGRHSGVDYAVPLNRPIYAPVSGQLTNIVSPTGGNMVQIFDGKYYHRLMHNNSFSRNNGRVSEGEEVAKAGTTGLSTGVHVHWDVTSKRVPTSFSDFIDPMEYIKQGGKPMFDEDEFYMVYRGMLGNDPSPEEAKALTRDAKLLVRTLWNNGSKARYEADKSGSHDVTVDGVPYKKG